MGAKQNKPTSLIAATVSEKIWKYRQTRVINKSLPSVYHTGVDVLVQKAPPAKKISL